jgi:hypothetical protein
MALIVAGRAQDPPRQRLHAIRGTLSGALAGLDVGKWHFSEAVIAPGFVRLETQIARPNYALTSTQGSAGPQESAGKRLSHILWTLRHADKRSR